MNFDKLDKFSLRKRNREREEDREWPTKVGEGPPPLDVVAWQLQMADSLHDKENDGDTPTDFLDDYSWLCFLIIFELVVHYWLYNLWLISRVVLSRCGHEI